ncbi:MAG: hypothetical protein U0790_13430 [Isosphaeraceae bacterium]
MSPPWLMVDLDDEAQTARLSAWIASWDATLSVLRPPANALLYEPDATLYGVGLGGSMTIRLDHRERVVRAGDLIVVPPALALEIEPEVDLLACACLGTPPEHFRARFVQVWGYEHLPAALAEGPSPSGPAHLLGPEDLRFRVRYATASAAEGSPRSRSRPTHSTCQFWSRLRGSLVVSPAGHGPMEIQARHAAASSPDWLSSWVVRALRGSLGW